MSTEEKSIAADSTAPVGSEARLRAQTDSLLRLWSRSSREFIAERSENRIMGRHYRNCDKAEELFGKMPMTSSTPLTREQQLLLFSYSDEMTDPDAALSRIPAARQAWEDGCVIMIVQLDQKPYGQESCVSYMAGAPKDSKLAQDQLALNTEVTSKASAWYFGTHDWFLENHPGFIESKVRPDGFGPEAANIIWTAQQKRCAACGNQGEKLLRCTQVSSLWTRHSPCTHL